MKTALFAVALLLMWGCSSGGSDSDPCDNITCSGHGTCVVNSGSASCNCDTGYRADGLACLINSTSQCSSNDDCADNSDGKTVCDLQAGSGTYQQCIQSTTFNCNQCASWERCNDQNSGCDLLADKCRSAADCAGREDGKTACGGDDGHSCVEPTTNDPCKDQKCSGHGVCKVENDLATCDCFEGYAADGLTCNPTAISCSDLSCGEHGDCVEEGGVRCICDYHYVQSSGSCVFLVDLFNEAISEQSDEKLNLFWTNYDGPIRWDGKMFFVTKGNSSEDTYVAGDFNGWNPDTHIMTKAFNDEYRYLEVTTTIADDEMIAYKYISSVGGWYADVDNHIHHFSNPDGNSYAYPATRGRLLKYNIPSPELGDSERKVYVYLPGAYFTTRIQMAVIYMQDGHNLFDGDPEAIYGAWGVAGTLEAMITADEIKPAIIVGIKPNNRNDEYLYTTVTRANINNTPKLDLYMKYLRETLMPVINRQFRTSTHKENTIMAGSSFGGISSFKIAWDNSDLFGKVAAFSPSFWVGEPDGEDTGEATSIREMIQGATSLPGIKIYLDSGDTNFDETTPYTADSRIHVDHVRNALIIKGWDLRDEWLESGATAPVDYPATTDPADVPTLYWSADTPDGYDSYTNYLKPENNLLHLVGAGHKHNEPAWRERFRAGMMFLLPKVQ